MTTTIDHYWDVRIYTETAKGIAYDGCHKVYVLMDDEQVELMKGYGYGEEGSFLITSDQLGPDDMATVAMTWYKDSCGLKFIQSVMTNEENSNEGFFDIIAQFEENEDEDDD